MSCERALYQYGLQPCEKKKIKFKQIESASFIICFNIAFIQCVLCMFISKDSPTPSGSNKSTVIETKEGKAFAEKIPTILELNPGWRGTSRGKGLQGNI